MGRPQLQSSRGPLAHGWGFTLGWGLSRAWSPCLRPLPCPRFLSDGSRRLSGLPESRSQGGRTGEWTCPRETWSHSPGLGEDSRPRLLRGWRGPRRQGLGGWRPLGDMGLPPRPPGPARTGQLWGHHAQGPQRGLWKGLQCPGLFAAPRPSATCQSELGSQVNST